MKPQLEQFKNAVLKQRDRGSLNVPALYAQTINVIGAHNDLFSEYPTEGSTPAFSFVNEVVRTAHMLTGLVLALDEKSGDAVHFLEAGCGTGFFVLSSLLLDARVRALGVDIDPRAWDASFHLINAFPELSRRLVGLHLQDLQRNPELPFVPDLVVAEHICGDLRTEPVHRVQRVIPRKSSTTFIPHGIDVRLSTGFSVAAVPGDPLGACISLDRGNLQTGPARKIVLHREPCDRLNLQGSFLIPGGSVNPLGLAMTIHWHHRPGGSVSYGYLQNIDALGNGGHYDATLSGPHPIYVFDRTGYPGTVLGVKNPFPKAVLADVEFGMRLGDPGLDCRDKDATPLECDVSSDSDTCQPVLLRI